MKRFWVGGAALAFLVLPGGAGFAQSTLDALTEELNEVQQQHSDATAQNLTNFFSQVDQAMGDSNAAVKLWQDAGGSMPPPTPVTTVHESESASERDARQAQDLANAGALAGVVQVHCGLLHYAAIFVTDPNRKGLQDDFNGWLQKMAQVYPRLGVMPASSAPAPDENGGQHHHHNGGGGGAPPPMNLGDIMGKSMKDSIITKFLAFKSWGDKEQGGWSVRDIPKLFKADILDPSRATPSPATLQAWDTYIAMEQAGDSDSDKWTTTDYPPLQFERACDDYAITPGSEKLEVLVQIIHANPTHPNADDWIKRTKGLLDAYKAAHGGAAVAQNNVPPPPAPAASTNSNVTVTTQQQGDAQIITTHTNTATNPAPP